MPGVVSPLFGPIVSGDTVEEWTRTTLELWFPTYLREVERQMGLDPNDLPNPRSYTVSSDREREAEDQLPAVVIVSPGTVDDPLLDGEGMYRVKWQIGVGIYCSALDHDSTKRLVRAYGSAARAIMLHKQTLGGNANGTDWVSESYDVLAFDDSRTIGAGLIEFNVEVSQAQRKWGGPAAPDEDPSDGPVVEEVIIDESPQPAIAVRIEQDDIITVITDEDDPDYPYKVH